MDLNQNNMKKIMFLIVFAALVFLGGQNIPTIFNTIFYTFGVLTPLILGFCMAFVLNVFMRLIELLWDKIVKKDNFLKRPISLILTFAVVFVILFILMFMIVPEISRSIVSIIDMLPSHIDRLEKNITAFAEEYHLYFVDLASFDVNLEKFTESLASVISTGGQAFINATVSVTSSIFSAVINFALGFVFAIYMLLQKEKISSQIRRVLYAFLDKEKVSPILEVGTISNRIFSKFVTGQLLEACLLGILCFIGMTILQMPYATMISSLVGVTALVPVLGAFIGTGIGACLIFLVNPMQAFWFIVFIIVLQQFDSNIIYPKVVGKSVGLPGIWVLAAVTIGGSLYGIIGMLLSVPLCSVIYILLKAEVNRRIKRKGMEKAEI